MDPEIIRSALADVTNEKDPTVKSAKLASLCTALWAERGIELVVVGGSAIELLTEGAYASGDLDMCHITVASLPIRQRQEIMGMLGCDRRTAKLESGRNVFGFARPGRKLRTNAFSASSGALWRHSGYETRG